MSSRAKWAAVLMVGVLACVAVAIGLPGNAQESVPIGESWIYEDIDAGYAKAAETGKPLLVAFR